jgi:hypothetical protein
VAEKHGTDRDARARQLQDPRVQGYPTGLQRLVVERR